MHGRKKRTGKERLRELKRDIDGFESQFAKLLEGVEKLSPETAAEFREFREAQEVEPKVSEALVSIIAQLDAEIGEPS